jgi:SpoIID/LytB domain protein
MSANASLELLKAHAVISRSWLLSQVLQKGKKGTTKSSMLETENERVKWYDREDHNLFDVCADDHCQRYQGVTKASSPNVRLAIHHTRGQVMRSGSELCDARFSKCCGGYLEEFQYCWEQTPLPYLKGKHDGIIKEQEPTVETTDLRQEPAARAWILGNPPSFCNTHDPHILSQVLNNYDRETPDFYRWRVDYNREAISELFARRTGMDVGDILELEPLERGVSGRIVRLRVVGSKKTVVIGKELEIRKALSNTHLYSSAFVVEKTATGFTLHGAGWGHGVGLCQIGAAVMGEQGYSYKDILTHYYPSTTLDALYP